MTSTASPTVNASRWNWVPAGNPRTSPGTGSATLIEGLVPDRPTAVRKVCSNDTEPESSNSGQGRPVRTAAWES